jgi:hypothetical protein
MLIGAISYTIAFGMPFVAYQLHRYTIAFGMPFVAHRIGRSAIGSRIIILTGGRVPRGALRWFIIPKRQWRCADAERSLGADD